MRQDELAIVRAGRDASFARSFERWVAVARGIKVLRDEAKAIGGKKTFQLLLTRSGYDDINPSVITKLLKILDRLPEVEAWRETLTDKQRREWSAPTTVFKHCPVFNGARKKD